MNRDVDTEVKETQEKHDHRAAAHDGGAVYDQLRTILSRAKDLFGIKIDTITRNYYRGEYS
jgi:hypothetical protein